MYSNPNEEEQSNELEALKSIYMGDFETVYTNNEPIEAENKTKEKKETYRIKIVPFPNDQGDNYSQVYLNFQYCSEYPNVVPKIEIEKGKGLSDEQIKELQQKVLQKAKELIGGVMMFDIAQLVQEYLLAHNQQPLSFYDEMIQRQNAQKKIEEEKEQNLIQREKKKLLEEEEVLEGLIQAELKRQAALHDISTDYGEEEDTLGEEDFQFEVTHENKHESVPLIPSPTFQKKIRWQRKQELGRGSVGTVFSATNVDTGKTFAIKEIILSSGNSPQKKETILSIAKDIDKLRKLPTNPHIVKYLGCEIEEAESVFFRVFEEYVPNGNMTSLLMRAAGQLEEKMIRKYARQILIGLRFLHTNSHVHGNLKLNNIVLHNNTHLKLCDYAISADLNELFDESGTGKNADYWSSMKVADKSSEYGFDNLKYQRHL